MFHQIELLPGSFTARRPDIHRARLGIIVDSFTTAYWQLSKDSMDPAMDLQTHRITEVAPRVFGMLLAPCSCQVLSHLLVPLASSTVWLVAYHPIGAVEWRDIALPLTPHSAPRMMRARLPRYDLQFALPDFLDLLPEMHAPAGMLAIQLSRPVPDTLVMEHLIEDPDRHRILEQNGWLLSFDLPHDGEYAWIESPDRAHLEAIRALPLLHSGELS